MEKEREREREEGASFGLPLASNRSSSMCPFDKKHKIYDPIASTQHNFLSLFF